MHGVTMHPTNVELVPDDSRVLVRPFNPGADVRWENILSRALAMTEDD